MKEIRPKETILQAQRAAWLKDHPITPEMSVEEVYRLSDELARLYPLTPEEREQRSTHVDAEFVL